jgi:hypothetical protein
MPLTAHMCQEANSTYRRVTSLLINWNLFTFLLPFIFLVLKTQALRAFLRTNTERKVSLFLSVYSSYTARFYVSTSLIKFVLFIVSFVFRLHFTFEFVILETRSSYTAHGCPYSYCLLSIVTTRVTLLHRIVTILYSVRQRNIHANLYEHLYLTQEELLGTYTIL